MRPCFCESGSAVERALKKYVCEEIQQSEKEDEHEGKE